MRKKEKHLGLGWIALALVFLFNPNIMMIDVLPDFIGYWLLCVAFSRLADLHESIGAAVALFRRMIFVDAAKILAILWVFGMSVTSERTSSILLWTFVFGVLELIFLLPAYSKLFDGITGMGFLYSNATILEAGGKRYRKSRTDRIRNFTWFFVGLKAILPVLPELADLSNIAYDETSGFINLYRYIGLMRVMAFIPVLIVGIVWLCKAQLYFARLRRDPSLWEELRHKYDTEIRPKVGIFVRRELRLSYFLLILALGLTMDFKLDSQNYLPDFFAAIVFFILFIVLTKKNRHRGWLGGALPYFLISLLASFSEYYFFDHYRYGVLIKNEEAMLAYGILLVCNILKGLAFLAVIGFFIREMKEIISHHTGYVLGRDYHNEREEKMISVLHGELNRSLLCAGIASIVYVLADLAHDFLIPNYNFVVVIPVLFGIVCIGFFVRAMSAIQNAIDTKYMLE